MKVAFCGKLGGKSSHPGGASVTEPSIAKFIAEQGHQVFYFGRNTPSSLENDLIVKEDIELYHLKELPELVYFPLMPFRAFWLLKDRFSEFDVVYAFIGSFAVAAAYLKKRCPKVKLCIKVQEVGQPKYEPLLKGKLYLSVENWLMKTACKRADAVIVHSQYMKETVAKEWGIKNCTIVPHGIDVSLFKPVVVDEEQHNKLWGDAERKLLFVGRLVYRKGVMQLIESAKHLMAGGLSFRLVMVGDGPLRQSMERLISDSKLSNHVYLYGRAEHDVLLALYTSADFTIVPSIYEPFGMVPLESLACGTPAIVSYNTAMKETIEPGVGYFIPEIIPESITDTIRHAISSSLPSPEHCRQFVCQRHDLGKIYPLYEELFRRLT